MWRFRDVACSSASRIRFAGAERIPVSQPIFGWRHEPGRGATSSTSRPVRRPTPSTGGLRSAMEPRRASPAGGTTSSSCTRTTPQTPRPTATGNLVITARVGRTRARLLLRTMQVHLGPIADGGSVRADLWADRGQDQGPHRGGSVARILDAGHEHRDGRLAQLRRDRHHGERRPPARAALRNAPWPGVFGIQWIRQDDRPAGARRRRLPRVRRRLAGGPHRLDRGWDGLQHRDTGRCRAERLGLQPPVLPVVEPRGWRELRGPVSAETVFPASMVVDYVRVYQAPG